MSKDTLRAGLKCLLFVGCLPLIPFVLIHAILDQMLEAIGDLVERLEDRIDGI
jgi:hypothetical protein